MSEKYPMDIHPIMEFEGSTMMGFWTKGHHSPEQFVEAFNETRDVKCEKYAPLTEDNKKGIKHCWDRFVPVSHDPDRRVVLEDAKPNTRGAFPVTAIYFY